MMPMSRPLSVWRSGIATYLARLLVAMGMAVMAAPAAAGPPPPQVLAPYIHDGVFDPGDYAWLQGRFPEASAQSKAQTQALYTWLSQCRAQDQLTQTRALAAMGVEHPQLLPTAYQDDLCDAVGAVTFDHRWPSFAAFAQDLKEATPRADAFIWAARIADEDLRPGPDHADLAQTLRAMPLGEQILRYGNMGMAPGASQAAPDFTPGIRAIFRMRVNRAIHQADHANTETLKAIVRQQGWPRRSAVGDVAADQAWLIVQHADRDPVFQLTALRLMEPMVAGGEVSKANYAYLYDRVMLKLTGKQRYATQSICEAGRWVSLPLEDARAADQRRAEAGLSPLRDYMAQMEEKYGPCPLS
jgi:hypothetical protein